MLSNQRRESWGVLNYTGGSKSGKKMIMEYVNNNPLCLMTTQLI